MDIAENQLALVDCVRKNDEVAEVWDKWVEARGERPARKEIKSHKPGQNSIKTLRRELGWVSCELDDMGKVKTMTKRRTRR